MINRLREFIEYKGLNVFAFEKSVGLSNNTIRKKLDSGRNNMGTDTLQAILNTYTELSAEWLLLGIGNMLKNDTSQNKDATPPDKTDTESPETLKETLYIIKQQQQTISDLTKALTTLIEQQSKL